MGFGDERRGWTFSWCHLVPPSCLLSLETPLFRPANGSFTTSAGHYSVHTHFIASLETSAHSAAQAGPASASWVMALRLCIILPKFLILRMFCLVFWNVPLKILGKVTREQPLGSVLPCSVRFFIGTQKAFPFSFSMLHLGHSCDVLLPIPLSNITWMESRHPSASAFSHWFFLPTVWNGLLGL